MTGLVRTARREPGVLAAAAPHVCRSKAARIVLTLFAALLPCLAGPVPAHGYAFLLIQGGQGLMRRWPLANLPGGRVPWMLSNRMAGNITGDRSAFDTLTQAFATWEALPTSGIRFAFTGGTDAHEANPNDGVNLLTLAADQTLPSGVLAVTFVSSDLSGNILDADTVFNRNFLFTTNAGGDGTRYDLQSVATHEIGHIFGLEHSGLLRATMAPAIPLGEMYARTPESDDQIGAALLYPDGGFPSGTGSVEGDVTLQGGPVFLAHVIASDAIGRVVAAAFTDPSGHYRIDGLAPNVYVIVAEPLDDPITPSNVGSIVNGFRATPTTGYSSAFH